MMSRLAILLAPLAIACATARAADEFEYNFEVSGYAGYVLDVGAPYGSPGVGGGFSFDFGFAVPGAAGSYYRDDPNSGLKFTITITPDANPKDGATASLAGTIIEQTQVGPVLRDVYADTGYDYGGGIGLDTTDPRIFGFGTATVSPGYYAIPEPSNDALLIVGLSMLGGFGARRRHTPRKAWFQASRVPC